VPRGALRMLVKSLHFMSSATPNSTKARIRFSASSDAGMKWSLTASISTMPCLPFDRAAPSQAGGASPCACPRA